MQRDGMAHKVNCLRVEQVQACHWLASAALTAATTHRKVQHGLTQLIACGAGKAGQQM